MSMGTHIDQLRKKHESLSMKVEDAMRHPGFDDLEIAQLKKEKLRLKEEITRLSAT